MMNRRRLNAAAVAQLLESEDGEFEEDANSEEDEVISEVHSEGTSNDGSSDESETEPTTHNADSYMLSRNKTVKWYYTPRPSRRARAANIVRQRPGPSRFIQQTCATPENCFFQFVTRDMIREIVQHTNAEGRQRDTHWNDTSEEEIERFIGAVLLAGVYISKNESVTQLWSNSDGRPIFQKIMPRNRFSELLTMLRFDDKATRQVRRANDKLAPLRRIWNEFIAKCRANYVPHEQMTIDEQLVTFRGRCPFKMFIPSKPGRYGIKIWALCDSENSYCYNAEVYTGRRGGAREVNQSTRVVLELTEPLTNTGRNIVGDNFFSSLNLVQCLDARQLTYFGTIRRNKPELPGEFQPRRDRVVGSSTFGFHEKVLIVSFVPKKNKSVNLISSLHSSPEVSHVENKPQVILDYNAAKSGVDTMDQNVRKYSCKRRTLRWPMCLFYNILDIAAMNTFVIFRDLHPQWNANKPHRRRLFLILLARQLAKVLEDEIVRLPRDPVQAAASQRTVHTRKRCHLCGWEKDRKTSKQCCICGLHVCPDHSDLLCLTCSA